MNIGKYVPLQLLVLEAYCHTLIQRGNYHYSQSGENPLQEIRFDLELVHIVKLVMFQNSFNIS